MILTLLIAAVVLGLCGHVLHTRSVRGNITDLWTLLALLAAGITLRAWGLGDSSFEHLEASYLFEAIKPETLWGVVTSRQSAEQMHQPLYPLLLRGWADIQLSESWVRIPSLLLSVLCVPLVWTLVRDAHTATSARLAAAMTALAPLLVWYGRDASPYALLAAVSLAAIASAGQQLSAPVHGNDRRLAVRTGVLLSLAFYTHFHGGWVAITVGAWLLLSGGWRFKSLWITTATTAALCLPWLPALIHKLTTSVEGLERDQALMRYSHDLTEALPEAGRLLIGGPSGTWALGLLLVLLGSGLLLRQRHVLGHLLVAASVVGLAAELHILWQLQTSKGIVYVDVRHYLYLAPVLLVGAATLPRSLGAAVLVLQLATSVPLVSTDKPDVRSAMAYVRKHATGPEHGVGYLPAPWYEPLVEFYLTGACERLVHAHSREGWWSLDNCFYSEFPVEGAIYGYPPSAERFRQAAERTQLDFLWMVEIQDHRFGLRTPPTTLQEQWHCYKAVESALIRRKEFGHHVTVSVYDAARLRTLASPAAPADTSVRTVTSQKSWELQCRNPGSERIQ